LLVDVLINGEPAAEWRFTETENRGVRTLTVPRPPAVPATIELRPRSVATPRELNPASTDTRPLGVALHRLRVR
jgi:hypothetical protein